MAKEKINIGANPLPISFAQFVKNPKEGILFLAIIALSYLYIDIRGTFKEDKQSAWARISALEYKDSIRTQALIDCKTALSSTTTKIETWESMGAIKKAVK